MKRYELKPKRKKKRLLFSNPPQFTSVVEDHLKETEQWRFPEINIYAKNTIHCDVCNTLIVEVITKDEKEREITNFQDYPVYLKADSYYGANKIKYCKKCWEKKQ